MTLMRGLTSEELIERAERRQRLLRLRFIYGTVLGWILTALVGLYAPVHTWLHAHTQFFLGMFAGSVLEIVTVWLLDRETWLKWFSWQ